MEGRYPALNEARRQRGHPQKAIYFRFIGLRRRLNGNAARPRSIRHIKQKSSWSACQRTPCAVAPLSISGTERVLIEMSLRKSGTLLIAAFFSKESNYSTNILFLRNSHGFSVYFHLDTPQFHIPYGNNGRIKTIMNHTFQNTVGLSIRCNLAVHGFG